MYTKLLKPKIFSIPPDSTFIRLF